MTLKLFTYEDVKANQYRIQTKSDDDWYPSYKSIAFELTAFSKAYGFCL